MKISENLQQEALTFLDGVVSESYTNGFNEGRASGLAEGKTAGIAEGKTIGYNEGLEKGKAEGFASGKTVGYNEGFAKGKTEGYASGKTDGYNAGYEIGYNDGKQSVEPIPVPDPTPTPVDPEPVVESGYTTEKAHANIEKLLGDGDVLFAIMDENANVYKTGDEWKSAGSPNVLGIVYSSASGNRKLCMHIKTVKSSEFGGNGILFDKNKVFTSTDQWKTVYNDYTGESNTEGIIEKDKASLAAVCRNTIFANGKNGYMPAQAELRMYCKYFSRVDALLKAVGGDVLKTQNGALLIWSSTCRDKDNAWAVRYMKDGDAQPQYCAKTKKYKTRAFMTL